MNPKHLFLLICFPFCYLSAISQNPSKQRWIGNFIILKHEIGNNAGAAYNNGTIILNLEKNKKGQFVGTLLVEAFSAVEGTMREVFQPVVLKEADAAGLYLLEKRDSRLGEGSAILAQVFSTAIQITQEKEVMLIAFDPENIDNDYDLRGYIVQETSAKSNAFSLAVRCTQDTKKLIEKDAAALGLTKELDENNIRYRQIVERHHQQCLLSQLNINGLKVLHADERLTTLQTDGLLPVRCIWNEQEKAWMAGKKLRYDLLKPLVYFLNKDESLILVKADINITDINSGELLVIHYPQTNASATKNIPVTTKKTEPNITTLTKPEPQKQTQKTALTPALSQNSLSEGASLLFSNDTIDRYRKEVLYYTKLRLTPNEKEEIFDQMELEISSDKKQLHAKGDYGFENPLYTKVEIIDLNNDGKLEVFVYLYNVRWTAQAGDQIAFGKNSAGKFIKILEESGETEILLKTVNGYPDLTRIGRGMTTPTYNWNGTKYQFNKQVGFDSKTAPKSISFADFFKNQKSKLAESRPEERKSGMKEGYVGTTNKPIMGSVSKTTIAPPRINVKKINLTPAYSGSIVKRWITGSTIESDGILSK